MFQQYIKAYLRSEMIAELTKQRDTLTAELASAKADTALFHVFFDDEGDATGRTIREAIDAALASGEGKHE
jgi:predicted phosphoribosyltransferase